MILLKGFDPLQMLTTVVKYTCLCHVWQDVVGGTIVLNMRTVTLLCEKSFKTTGGARKLNMQSTTFLQNLVIYIL